MAAIATNEIGMHVLVRAWPKGEEWSAGNAPLTMNAINSLLAAKKPRELAAAVSAFPPLLPMGVNLEGGRGPRCASISDALSEPGSLRLGPVNPELLQYESHFDVGATPKNGLSAARNAQKACSFGSEWLRSISDSREVNGCELVIEPFADWAFVRNVAGLVSKLLALISSGSDSPMISAGFTKRDNETFGGEVWMIPFAYNPFFAPLKANLSSLAAKLGDYSDYQVLMSAITRGERVAARSSWIAQIAEKVIARCFGPECLDGGKAVFLLTAPVASGDYISLLGGWRTADERRYMLCTMANEGEEAVAKRVASALVDAVAGCRLQSEDGAIANLGWSECAETRFDIPPTLSMQRHSVFADIVYQIVYRGSNRIAICANCGCAVIQSNMGPLKEWCGPACRMSMIRRAEKASR
ncbi:hypothetical protein H6A16_04475 [Collinsella tanakaei]|uniref:hypothetical protein n=1 Tax=Collinsella tanakaei TaxID=626935 RepID=UPI001959D1E2|nr:hypothetical protein [Collinsella tanakaei]MBM6778751.1 hypothetical protein [Collinsella tanakaei]